MMTSRTEERLLLQNVEMCIVGLQNTSEAA